MTQNKTRNFYKIAGQEGLSGYWLKMIAVVTMLIDHTAASILLPMLNQMPDWAPVTFDNFEMWRKIYWICRIIGRMAFPLYCFLLVEGFRYTRSRGKYALRLFVFGIISEVPFDMALRRSFFDLNNNNVYWTLVIGLLTIWAADELSARAAAKSVSKDGAKQYAKENFRKGMIRILILLAGAFLAEILCTDYGAAGVFAIYIMYLFSEQRMAGFATMVAALGIMTGPIEFAALAMLIPMHFYNGKRGRQGKYFFYAFYPVHLLALAVLAYVLGLWN
jgi:hypothetical protein